VPRAQIIIKSENAIFSRQRLVFPYFLGQLPELLENHYFLKIGKNIHPVSQIKLKYLSTKSDMDTFLKTFYEPSFCILPLNEPLKIKSQKLNNHLTPTYTNTSVLIGFQFLCKILSDKKQI